MTRMMLSIYAKKVVAILVIENFYCIKKMKEK